MHERLRIELEQWSSLAVIDFESSANHLLISIINTIFLERAAAHARHHRLDIRAHQVKHREHFEILIDMLRLIHIARNAVEHQQVNIRLVDRQHRLRVHVLSPHLNREFIRHQLAARGVLHKTLAEIRSHVERAKHIAAGKVIEARNLAEDLALRALTSAWSAKEQNGFVASRW